MTAPAPGRASGCSLERRDTTGYRRERAGVPSDPKRRVTRITLTAATRSSAYIPRMAASLASDQAAPRFTRHPPAPALARWVECIWSVSGTGTPGQASRVLPDGSNDIIVDFRTTPRAFVVGAMRHAEIVPLPGRVDLLGIRFRPGGALPFLQVPLNELTGRQVGLDEVWGRRADALTDGVASVGMSVRVACVQRLLLERLGRRRTEDELAAGAVEAMRRTRGAIGIAAVAAALGVGERRLQRIFDLTVGLSPKRLASVLRFLHAVRLLGLGRSGTAVAFEAGYADQAHFIRDFRTLAGVTPRRFLRERAVGFVQDGARARP